MHHEVLDFNKEDYQQDRHRLQQKRKDLWRSNSKDFLNDNAPAHNSLLVSELLTKNHRNDAPVCIFTESHATFSVPATEKIKFLISVSCHFTSIDGIIGAWLKAFLEI